MAAVPVPLPVMLCNLSDFIRVAATGQHKKQTGYGKFCSGATYHTSCSSRRRKSDDRGGYSRDGLDLCVIERASAEGSLTWRIERRELAKLFQAFGVSSSSFFLLR